MQRLMRLHPHIVPIEQAVELCTRKPQHRIPNTRPVKAILFKSLVTENEAVALPHQDLELVMSRVDEREHRPRERIEPDDVPRQDRQPVDLPPHIHRRSMQVDTLDAAVRPQHPADLAAPPTANSAVATRHTRSPILARTPAGTPCRCAPLPRPRRALPASSSPAPLQTCSCACAAGLSPAVPRRRRSAAIASYTGRISRPFDFA